VNGAVSELCLQERSHQKARSERFVKARLALSLLLSFSGTLENFGAVAAEFMLLEAPWVGSLG
jgi:hypothetical protein